MILTKGEQMVMTPTYHLFDMYKVHHDATFLPVDAPSSEYTFGDQSMPALSLSASRDRNNKVHVSIVNAHARDSFELTCDLQDLDVDAATGRILTSETLDAHNTFDAPKNLQPITFDGAAVVEGQLKVHVPPRAVIVLQLSKS